MDSVVYKIDNKSLILHLLQIFPWCLFYQGLITTVALFKKMTNMNSH